MENEKIVLYDLHDKLNGMFTSNSKLSDEQGTIKKIGLNETTVTSGALSKVNGMLSNVAPAATQNESMPVSNNVLQPATPETVPAESGVPAYGVPVEPTVAVTPNMFENPLDGVYTEAKNFIDSEENSTGFTNTVVEPQLNDNPTINNGVPVMEQTVIPEVKEEAVSPVNSVEMPVQPQPVVEPNIPQTPVMNDVVAPAPMPSIEPMTMPSEPVVNNAVESVTPVLEEQAPVNTSNEPLVQDTASPINTLTDVIPTVEPISEVKESEIDIKNEIDEVIEAIDNAKEKLISLKEKMNKKENVETKVEEPVSMVSPEVPVVPETPTTLEAPAIQETPVVPIMPNVQPIAQDNMLDINSFFGKAA